VVSFQETFSTEDVLPFELDGFMAYHTPARYTTRRPQWGMTSLFKIRLFVGGRLSQLPTPCEWIQLNRWTRRSGLGVLFLNVYVPAHSRGRTVTDVSLLATLFDDLAQSFPGDIIICGGDLNVDRWRLVEQTSAGRPPPAVVRYLTWKLSFSPMTVHARFGLNLLIHSRFIGRATGSLLRDLEAKAFSVRPEVRTITYMGPDTESNLDYWITSSSCQARVGLGPYSSAQHRPLELHSDLSFPDGTLSFGTLDLIIFEVIYRISLFCIGIVYLDMSERVPLLYPCESFCPGLKNTLDVRERNFYFDYAAISRVQRSLEQLPPKLHPSTSLDDTYSAILGCFYEHGRVSNPRPMSSRQEPWMSFLSSDELEV
jgi:hypothetical protein